MSVEHPRFSQKRSEIPGLKSPPGVPRPGFEKWPGTGYPPIAGESDPAAYYERYLKKRHPEWTEKKIRRKVELAMQSELFREILESLEETDEEIRRKYPEWHWTTWFDAF